MTKDERIEKAREIHKNGFNCSQAVFCAFCEDFGIDFTSGLRLAAGFGGGFHSGKICGAISGAAIVIGLKYGQTEKGDMEQKKICNEKIGCLLSEFRKKYGAVDCIDLLHGKMPSPDTRPGCRDKVAAATEILCEMGF